MHCRHLKTPSTSTSLLLGGQLSTPGFSTCLFDIVTASESSQGGCCKPDERRHDKETLPVTLMSSVCKGGCAASCRNLVTLDEEPDRDLHLA